MILTRLHALAQDLRAQGTLPPPGYAVYRPKWILRLTADGALLDPPLVAAPDGVDVHAPTITRTSGDRPQLAFDKGEYVLGVAESDDERHAARAAKRHQLFSDLHRSIAATCSSPRLAALIAALPNLPGVRTTAAAAHGDWIAIQVDGAYIHEDLAVAAAWWAYLREAGTPGICCVTGQPDDLVDTWPPIRKLGNAVLSSQNQTAFTDPRGGKPKVGKASTTDISAALDFLLSHTDHRWHLGDRRTSRDHLVWWVNGHLNTNPLAALLGKDAPEQAKRLLGAPRSTVDPKLRAARFTAIHVGARNDARIVLNDAIDAPLADIDANIRQWLQHTTVRTAREPVRRSISAVAWDISPRDGRAAESDRGRITGQLMRCALSGDPIPLRLVRKAVSRCLTPPEDPRSRVPHGIAGLLQAHLSRTAQEDLMTLDTDNDDPGYVLGRLIAITEHIQTSHRPDVSRTVADRVMRTAATRPPSALPILERTARVHLNGLQRTHKGRAVWLDKQLQQAMSRMQPEGPPARLDTHRQARLVLGYHHQRQALWTKQNQPDTPDTEASA